VQTIRVEVGVLVPEEHRIRVRQDRAFSLHDGADRRVGRRHQRRGGAAWRCPARPLRQQRANDNRRDAGGTRRADHVADGVGDVGWWTIAEHVVRAVQKSQRIRRLRREYTWQPRFAGADRRLAANPGVHDRERSARLVVSEQRFEDRRIGIRQVDAQELPARTRGRVAVLALGDAVAESHDGQRERRGPRRVRQAAAARGDA
jgi:hypothetical protein